MTRLPDLESLPTQPPRPTPTLLDRATQRGPQLAARNATENRVELSGRVTAEPALRELSNGELLVTWRVEVARPLAEQRPFHSVDTITCVSFSSHVQAGVRGWRIDDMVRVQGALRRRRWRSATGVSVVYEVEVRKVSQISSVRDQPS